jgi:ABC-type dipeptide/oligopeptide/nickel transport system permease component
MVFGSIFVGVTILIDLIVAFLDPRIRLSQRGGQ